MNNNLSFNSISTNILKINSADLKDVSKERATLIAKGRTLAYEYAARGKDAIAKAIKANTEAPHVLNATQYNQLNAQFQQEHLMYAAKKGCEFAGLNAPSSYEEFKANAATFYKNSAFLATLQAIHQEVITPILPAVYSEAVSQFADVVEVGFGETYSIAIDSNDIPIFQDSSWGAARSVPRNTLYSKEYTLNPQPKTAELSFKFMQLLGTGMDFGKYFANIIAGVYAKTMGMWKAMMDKAVQNTSLVPSGLNYTFNTQNWMSAANKVSALNHTTISNLIATGGAIALSKVLPVDVAGASNVNMDAAIASMLGSEYVRSGYIGEFMAVRLLPMVDAIAPGTQNTTVETMLDQTRIYMMASSGRKPLTIGISKAVPLTLAYEASETSDFTIGVNLTIALDAVATFASKMAVITV